MFYRVKGHCCCSFFLTVEGLITTKVLKGQRHCCITYLEGGGGGGGGGQESLASCMSSRAQIWSRELQNARSPELPAGPATARERIKDSQARYSRTVRPTDKVH